ncbi:MAG TPA: FAD-linked oxidase C-terminal domain-containing protein [Thermomicrobiales bacterium]|jgi:glycolate oxidase|nr:FAD-linked oxidase C-terminal domain-containing protein [Thermomicrobiales bacterium]
MTGSTSAATTMTTQELVRQLGDVVGSGNVYHRPADLLVYEYDGSVEGAVDIARPAAVVLPRTTEEVAAVVRIANAAGLPVTARGAGTGLSGGAVAQRGGVIVAMSRMDRVLEVDYVDRTALVQPGVVNLELSEYTQPQGFFFAPDPSSQKVSTIGGNVAENAGGPHCVKYGVTTNHILGLEVVLPDGTITRTGALARGGMGYDLTGIVVGSEGMLGIVTEVLVRLTPVAEQIRVFLAAFREMEAASHAVGQIIAAGIVPAALEMVDNLTIQAVEPVYHAGYPMDAAAVLLIELDGLTEEVEADAALIDGICRGCGSYDIRAATSVYEREQLWKGRKMALAAMGRLAPNYYLHDTVVPRSRLPQTLAEVRRITDSAGLRCAQVFHAGDGNLHPLMLFDRSEKGAVDRVLHASHEIIHACVEAGGSLSGEHGIGTEKRNYMPFVYTGEDLAAMAGVKMAFDPREMFNPEKVFPSGFRCGEVRALHNQLRAQRLMREHGIVPV